MKVGIKVRRDLNDQNLTKKAALAIRNIISFTMPRQRKELKNWLNSSIKGTNGYITTSIKPGFNVFSDIERVVPMMAKGTFQGFHYSKFGELVTILERTNGKWLNDVLKQSGMSIEVVKGETSNNKTLHNKMNAPERFLPKQLPKHII